LELVTATFIQSPEAIDSA